MRRLLTRIILILSFGILLMGCSNKKMDDSEPIKSEADSNKEEEEEAVSYQWRVYEKRFLKKDEVFQLALDSYDNPEYIYVDLKGNIKSVSDLKFEYPEIKTCKENGVTKDLIVDLEGNDITDRFLKDSENEEILGLDKIENDDYIITVKESKETPTSSYNALKFYNEKGENLCQIDSDDINPYLEGRETTYDSIRRVDRIYWGGDYILKMQDANRNFLFSINIQTGEFLPADVLFEQGYSVTDFGVIDEHGNVVSDFQSDSHNFSKIFDYSDGVFFNGNENCFMDKDLNMVISLNDYHPRWTADELAGKIEKDTHNTPFVFRDGYCQIDVCNDAGINFYGIIDGLGNIIYPYSQEKIFYSGLVGDGLLQISNTDVFDIKAGEVIYGPMMVAPYMYEGCAYWVDKENTFHIYDFRNDELLTL